MGRCRFAGEPCAHDNGRVSDVPGTEVVPAGPRPPQLVTPRRILLSLILGAAAVGIFVSFAQTRTEEGPRYIDSAIEAVYPAAGDLDLRQARIGIDLHTGYTALLFVDGVRIPEDQLERVEPLSQVFYTPGRGKETGALEPGRHCATAQLWRIVESSRNSRNYS